MKFACSWLALLIAAPVFGQSFTSAQADRGASLYQERCAACHGEDVQGDGNGITPPLFGPVFVGNWDGLPLAALLDRIGQEAQQAKPAGLSKQQQADVLAFLLLKNDVAAGSSELTADPTALSTKLSTVRVKPQGSTYPPAFPRKNATMLFDTDRFTVWDIVWPKGEPTPLHRHLYDQVGTYYQPGGRKITTPDGDARQTSTEAGSLSNTRAGTTHIEEGTTEPPLRAVFIELKKVPGPVPADAASADASGSLRLLDPQGAARVLNDERVTIWDWTANRTGPFRVQPARDLVVVWLGTGETHYVPGGTAGDIGGRAGARALLFEIK